MQPFGVLPDDFGAHAEKLGGKQDGLGVEAFLPELVAQLGFIGGNPVETSQIQQARHPGIPVVWRSICIHFQWLAASKGVWTLGLLPSAMLVCAAAGGANEAIACISWSVLVCWAAFA